MLKGADLHAKCEREYSLVASDLLSARNYVSRPRLPRDHVFSYAISACIVEVTGKSSWLQHVSTIGAV